VFSPIAIAILELPAKILVESNSGTFGLFPKSAIWARFESHLWFYNYIYIYTHTCVCVNMGNICLSAQVYHITDIDFLLYRSNMSIFASNSALQAWLPELPDRAPHLAPWLQVLFSYYFEQWMSNLLVDDYKILTTFKGVMILHILFNMMYIYILYWGWSQSFFVSGWVLALERVQKHRFGTRLIIMIFIPV